MISQAKAEWAKNHPQEQPKPSSGTSEIFSSWGDIRIVNLSHHENGIKHNVRGGGKGNFIHLDGWDQELYADNDTGAKADPKDPNADYLAVLGIEDK